MVFSFLSPSSQFFTIRTDRKQVLFIFSKLSNEKKTHGKIRTALRTNKIVGRLEKNKYIYISRGSFSLDIYIYKYISNLVLFAAKSFTRIL